MSVTAASPDSLRARAAEAVRRDIPPGAVRAAALRAVGFTATAEDFPEGPAAAREAARRERRIDHEARVAVDNYWPAFAEFMRKHLAESRQALTLWLPGLALESENAALRGKMGKQFGKGIDRIRVAHAAKRNAMAALMACAGPWHRVGAPVDISILQSSPERRIDPGNLWHKPLIDLLLANRDGLGILKDDSAKYVRTVTVGYGDGDDLGVMVTLTPSPQSPRRAALLPGSPVADRSRRSSHGASDPGAPLPGAVKEAGPS